MEGRVERIIGTRAKVRALAAFLKRHPFVKEFLSDSGSVAPQIASKVAGVQLYAFRPFAIWYVDNEVGFGTRWKLQVQDGKPVGNPIRA